MIICGGILMKGITRRTIAFVTAFLILFSLVQERIVLADRSRSNEAQVYNYLVGKMGLNTAAVCGVLANVKAESDFNPVCEGDNGTSFGLFQWHAGRKANLVSYCESNGLDYKTVEGQMRFLDYELKRSYFNVYNYIRSVDNTNDGAYKAGYYFCYYYEIPANRDIKADKRGESAKNVYWKKYEIYKGKIIKPESEMNPADYKVDYSRLLRVVSPNIVGADVLYMQLCLYCLGYDIDADGYYGPATSSVVRQFQSDNGLDDDGMCGSLTWKAIEAKLNGTKVKIINQPQSLEAKTGEMIQFSIRAVGSGLSYQWYCRRIEDSSWSKWNGMTSATVEATADADMYGMQVKCIVTDGSGNAAESQIVTVTVEFPITITTQPQSVTANVGDQMNFSVKATGKSLSYQWYCRRIEDSSWSKWNGMTSATIQATADADMYGMQVKCIVTDSSGNAAESQIVTVTVEFPITITTQPQSVTANVGDDVKFSVKARGISLSYQWYYKKAGATDWNLWKNYTYSSVTAGANEGWNGMQVKCVVTDGGGNSAESQAATVTM